MSKDNNAPKTILPGKPQEKEEVKAPETERTATEIPAVARPNNAIKQEPVRTYTPNTATQTGGTSLNAIESIKAEMNRYLNEIVRIDETIVPGVKIEPATERAYGDAQVILYNLILKVMAVKSMEEFRKQWLAIVVFIRKNKDRLNERSMFAGCNTWLNRKDQYFAYVRAATLLQTTSSMENPMMVRSVINLMTVEQAIRRVLPTIDVGMRLSHVYG